MVVKSSRQQLLIKIQFNWPTNYNIEQKMNRVSDFFDNIRIRGINTKTQFSYWFSLVWWTRYPRVTSTDFMYFIRYHWYHVYLKKHTMLTNQTWKHSFHHYSIMNWLCLFCNYCRFLLAVMTNFNLGSRNELTET